MKNIYISPEIKVITMKCESCLLAGSNPSSMSISGNDANSAVAGATNDAKSRHDTWIENDEEDYY